MRNFRSCILNIYRNGSSAIDIKKAPQSIERRIFSCGSAAACLTHPPIPTEEVRQGVISNRHVLADRLHTAPEPGTATSISSMTRGPIFRAAHCGYGRRSSRPVQPGYRPKSAMTDFHHMLSQRDSPKSVKSARTMVRRPIESTRHLNSPRKFPNSPVQY